MVRKSGISTAHGTGNTGTVHSQTEWLELGFGRPLGLTDLWHKELFLTLGSLLYQKLWYLICSLKVQTALSSAQRTSLAQLTLGLPSSFVVLMTYPLWFGMLCFVESKQGLSYFMHAIRVWTKTESSKLDFHVQKPSPMNSISRPTWIALSSSAPQNRVLWIQFVRNQICFKTCLTNNIVWVL